MPLHIYFFTNRRRAKDSILLIADRYGTNKMTVFVHNDNVYVSFNGNIPDGDINILMHYAQKSNMPLEDVFNLDELTELYKGNGIRRFRV